MIKKNITTLIIVSVAIIAFGEGFLVWKNYKDAARQEVQNQKQQKNEKKEKKENEQEAIDTSDWKTYRDEKYKFEIKYSKDWEIREEGKNAFGGEWLVVYDTDKNIIFQINRRTTDNLNYLDWISDNINPLIGKGKKKEILNYSLQDDSIYVFYVINSDIDDAVNKKYTLHEYFITNKHSIVYFNFNEIRSGKDKVIGDIKNMSFSQYLPVFEAMVRSIKFVD